MALRTCRDWRGIKHHLSQFSTDELLHLLYTAQQISEQIARFIVLLERELALRKSADLSTPSTYSHYTRIGRIGCSR